MAEETINNNNLGEKRTPPLSASGINGKRVASYIMLPGIIPEVKNLLKSNFGYIAFLIAIIYQMVRILPANHPYTRPTNIGRFTIRQVIAVAANHVKFDRKNIDQIVVFGAILSGMVLIVLQIISLLFFLFSGSAFAQITPGIFSTPSPDTDIAFIMIREVFGIPDLFGAVTPTGLHAGLQTLVLFYNYAILFVAVLIFVYYIITVVGETATTGVPFGQRFSHIYAPFRLVIAIGLLVPLGVGFNGAQYMAFYSAYLGSGLATQGWVRFNDHTSATNPLGQDTSTLIANANIPDMSGLVEGMATISACRAAYLTLGTVVVPYFIDPRTDNVLAANAGLAGADADAIYIFMRDATREAGGKGHFSMFFGDFTSFTIGQALANPDDDPLCGEVKIPIQVSEVIAGQPNGIAQTATPDRIQQVYFNLVYDLFFANIDILNLGSRIAWELSTDVRLSNQACGLTIREDVVCGESYLPSTRLRKLLTTEANQYLENEFATIFAAARSSISTAVSPEILATGWGGAGIWYNSIAELNGSFTTAVVNPPNVHKRPQVAQKIVSEKQQKDVAVNDCTYYSPNLAGEDAIELSLGDVDNYVGSVINQSHMYWRCDRGGSASNFFWDTMIAVFGLNGLFNIRDTIATPNGQVSIHPLAQLSTIGKGLVDSSVQNLGLAMASSFGGGMLGILSQHFGAAGDAASQMFVSIATIGLSVGFILYYILPFLPFMYFFFAVGGWVKGLFEAMIGTPLWALAHLRIDGDGLPGRSALSGYFLIFEIFLRPILTVFGLIGGLAIFTAAANILNEVFDIAVYNITGTELSTNSNGEVFGRHIIDEFFFTVVYAIILYMMATASFKMITLVPNNILRWIGQSVSAFNDNQDDPAAGLTQYAAMGGARIGGQLGQAATAGSKGLGQGLKGLADLGNGPTPPPGTAA